MGMIVSNVNNMFINHMFNRLTSFSNVRDTIGARNKVDPFRVLRVDRVLNVSKRIFYGIERFESRRDITLLNNMGNPIHRSLDIHGMNLRDRIRTSGFNPRCFANPVKGLEALRSPIPIIFKNFNKMRFLLLEVVVIRYS